MKTIEKYILGEFAKLLLIALFGFILLFLIVDLFENIDNLMRYNVPLLATAAFLIYKVPFIISQISPVAVLLAVLLSLGLLSKHGEITAMKAGGIRMSRVLVPLLASGFLISMAVIILNESITPAAARKVESFKREWFSEFKGSVFSAEGLWVKTADGIVNIRQTDLKKKELQGVTFYMLEKPFDVRRRISARSVKWKDGMWVADNAVIWTFREGERVESAEMANYVISGLGNPEELITVESAQAEMSLAELRRYVRELEADGYSAAKYRIDLYGKFTFPLVNFIMILVGVPFALKTGRHSGIAMGVGLSVVIAFSYWIVFALTRSLGQSGIIPPLIAALFPDALFLAIGLLMYGYVRQ